MTTHAYQLTIELTGAASPAASRERGYVTPAYDYLPGSVIRGAIAARWITTRGRPHDDPAAFAAHVAGLRVGPALPVDSSRLPLSVYRCKYPTTDTCRSTTVDAAFDELAPCPGCGTPLEQSRGQWTTSPRMARRSSTALDENETAAEKQLFARDEIAPRQTFGARAMGDLGWLGKGPTPLRVGGRRSVLGGALVTVRDEPPRPIPAPASTVVVALDSPAVFVDDCGRTRLLPQRGDLVRALRGTDAERLAANVTIDAAWLRPDSAGGWNAAGGLPKATEATTAAGSVFRLQFPEPLSGSAQAAMRDRGLGARRADGLGWVSIVSEPWRTDEAAAPEPSAQPVMSDGERVADDLRARHRSLVPKVVAWSREGYRSDPPGVAFSGLLDDAKTHVRRALALEGSERARFQIAAVASAWADSRSTTKEANR